MGQHSGNYVITSSTRDSFLLFSLTKLYCSCNLHTSVTHRANAPTFSCAKDVVVGVSGEFMMGWVEAVSSLGIMAYGAGN